MKASKIINLPVTGENFDEIDKKLEVSEVGKVKHEILPTIHFSSSIDLPKRQKLGEI